MVSGKGLTSFFFCVWKTFIFSSISFIFYIWVFDLFCINFYVWCVVGFSIWITNLSNTIWGKFTLYTLNYLCTFIKKQLTIYVWMYFYTVCSVPMKYVSITSLIPYYSLRKLFWLVVLVCLLFHINLEPACWIFGWGCAESIDQFMENWYLGNSESSNPLTWFIFLLI